MNQILEAFGLDELFTYGGGLLWAIASLSVLMWMMILERYSYLSLKAKPFKKELTEEWVWLLENDNHVGSRTLEGLVVAFSERICRGLPLIKSLTSVLPMLGLLGTVNGMIKIFEVMTAFGGGNVRGMASGISEALVTTMAGLLTALSGLYFANNLESRSHDQVESFRSRLHTLRGERHA